MNDQPMLDSTYLVCSWRLCLDVFTQHVPCLQTMAARAIKHNIKAVRYEVMDVTALQLQVPINGD